MHQTANPNTKQSYNEYKSVIISRIDKDTLSSSRVGMTRQTRTRVPPLSLSLSLPRLKHYIIVIATFLQHVHVALIFDTNKCPEPLDFCAVKVPAPNDMPRPTQRARLPQRDSEGRFGMRPAVLNDPTN